MCGVTLTLALSRRAGEGIGVVGGRGDDGVLCFSLGSRLRGNDGGVRVIYRLSTLALSHRGRGDVVARKKAGAVFGPVFERERSWICASAAGAAEANLTV